MPLLDKDKNTIIAWSELLLLALGCLVASLVLCLGPVVDEIISCFNSIPITHMPEDKSVYLILGHQEAMVNAQVPLADKNIFTRSRLVFFCVLHLSMH